MPTQNTSEVPNLIHSPSSVKRPLSDVYNSQSLPGINSNAKMIKIEEHSKNNNEEKAWRPW